MFPYNQKGVYFSLFLRSVLIPTKGLPWTTKPCYNLVYYHKDFKVRVGQSMFPEANFVQWKPNVTQLTLT